MEPTIFEDLSSFANELLYDRGEVTLEFSDKLVIQNNSQDNFTMVYKNVPSVDLNNFILQTELSLAESAEDSEVGLVIGWDGSFSGDSPDNLLRLVMSPKGKYSLDYVSNGQVQSIADSDSAFIHKGSADNLIEIQRIDGAVFLLFNNNEILSVELELFGNNFGFILVPGTSLSLNNLFFALASEPEIEETVSTPSPVYTSPRPTIREPKKKRGCFRIGLIIILVLILLWFAAMFANKLLYNK